MTKKRMSKAEQRSIALGAARSQLRHLGVSVDPFVPFQDVLAVLDDMNRAEPELVASQWYAQATDNQIQLLRRDWKKAVQPIYQRTLWGILQEKTNFEGVQKWRK